MGFMAIIGVFLLIFVVIFPAIASIIYMISGEESTTILFFKALIEWDPANTYYGIFWLFWGFLNELWTTATTNLLELVNWINPFHSKCVYVYIETDGAFVTENIDWVGFFTGQGGNILPETHFEQILNIHVGWLVRSVVDFIVAIIEVFI